MKTDFDSVADFHEKFGLDFYDPTKPPRDLPAATIDFRLKFLCEELTELAAAYGKKMTIAITAADDAPGPFDDPRPTDLPDAFDALLDLVYVALGTAHLHNFPWEEGFAEVQRANISKTRCGIDHVFVANEAADECLHRYNNNRGSVRPCLAPRVAHSVRGSALDVIKPKGWTPPDIIGVLRAAGAFADDFRCVECGGTGEIERDGPKPCGACGGNGSTL